MSAVKKISKSKFKSPNKIKAGKFIIGITGLTGAGKSTASEYLRKKGYTVIDVDRFAHELYRKGKPLYHKIIKEYTPLILKKSGEIDRKKLRSIVFSSVKEYKKFNALVFPALNKSLLTEIRKKKSGIVFIDMAVLFESGFFRTADRIIYIVRQRKEQAERKTEQKNPHMKSKIAAFQRIFRVSKKIALSDYIIYNDKSKNILYNKIKLSAERAAEHKHGKKRKRRT